MSTGLVDNIPARLVAEKADSFVGIPFRHRGRSREGVDCAGLLIAVAKELGLSYPDKIKYKPLPNLDIITQHLAAYCTPSSEIAAGVILRVRVFARSQHLAIVSHRTTYGSWTVVHADQEVGRVVKHSIDRRWLLKRVVSGWLINGTALEM